MISLNNFVVFKRECFLTQADIIEPGEDAAGISSSSLSSGGRPVLAGLGPFSVECLSFVLSSNYDRFFFNAENEVSFTLNLFQDGYSIGKPSEVCSENKLLFHG